MLTNVRTDERTNGQKLACLCLPAKAGVTKRGRRNESMLPDRISNPGPLTYESGALLIALLGPAYCIREIVLTLQVLETKTAEFANSIDPDEVAHNEPLHQDLHCLPSSF